MTTDTLAAAHEALRAGAWDEARVRFQAAVEAAPSGEACEGLGWAGWWLATTTSSRFDARERAFRALPRRGRSRRRRRAWPRGWRPTTSSSAATTRSRAAGSSGPHRLLDDAARCAGARLAGAQRGRRSRCTSAATRPGAGAGARGAARSAASSASPDLEAVGLALEGIALVSARPRRGGHAAARRGVGDRGAARSCELPSRPAWALCYLVVGLRGRRRLPARRAVVRGRCASWPSAGAARQLLGVCRSAYGQRARDPAATGRPPSRAHRRRSTTSRPRGPGMAGRGLVRLAELRARQGRADEARDALRRRPAPHPRALVGARRARARRRRRRRRARDAAERVLRRARPTTAARPAARARAARARARGARRARRAPPTADAELERGRGAARDAVPAGRARLARGRARRWRAATTRRRRAAEDAHRRFVGGRRALRGRAGPARARRRAGGARPRPSRAAPRRRAARERSRARRVARRRARRRGVARRGAERAARPRRAHRRASSRSCGSSPRGSSDAEIAERLVRQPAHRAPPRGQRAHQAAAAVARRRRRLRGPRRPAASRAHGRFRPSRRDGRNGEVRGRRARPYASRHDLTAIASPSTSSASGCAAASTSPATPATRTPARSSTR